MGAVSAILGGVALLGQVVGGQEAAKGQRLEGQVLGDNLDRQSRLLLLAGADARQRGGLAAGQARMQGSKVIGAQRAAAGGSGVAVDSGSTLRLMQDSRVMSELDALTLSNNAAREAWGYEVQSEQAKGQAKLARLGGIDKSNATMLTTGVNVFDGAMRLSGKG